MKTKEEIEFWHVKSHYQVYGETNQHAYMIVPTSIEDLVHFNFHTSEYRLYEAKVKAKPILRSYLKLKHSSNAWWNTPERFDKIAQLKDLKKQWIEASNTIREYKALLRCARVLENQWNKENENE